MKCGTMLILFLNLADGTSIIDKGTDYIYSIDTYYTEKNILKSENGIFMDMETGDIKWDEKPPYCVEIISENKIEKRYVDNKSDFCVIIIMDDKKVAVIDKKFENSMFAKLFLEKSGYNYFKPIYNNAVCINLGINLYFYLGQLAQLVRALRSHRRGHWFESNTAHHIFN